MKLFSDLKIGDKVFVINRFDYTFDVAEVIEVLSMVIRLQFYFNNTFNGRYCIWKYQKSKHIAPLYVFFTDEIEALEELRQTIKWQE